MMKTIIKAKWASHKGVQAALKSSSWLCPLVPSPGNSALLGALYILIDPLHGGLGGNRKSKLVRITCIRVTMNGCSGLITWLSPIWGKFESSDSKETGAVTKSLHVYSRGQIHATNDNNSNDSNTTQH